MCSLSEDYATSCTEDECARVKEVVPLPVSCFLLLVVKVCHRTLYSISTPQDVLLESLLAVFVCF